MSHDPAWDDLRAFLAVSETGSLSAAARQLKMAQPTVRRRIEVLERQLNTVLFTRSVAGLIPTDQARALRSHARVMALASDAFVRTASGAADKVAGTVRLSVSDVVGIEILPPMMARLRERHPGLAIEVVLSDETTDLIAQEADIAVRMYPPTQAQLVTKKVGTIPLCFFAHRDYVSRRGEPKDLADLASHDLIGPDRTRADLELARTLHPALEREKIVFRTDSHPAQLAAVRAGVGIGVIQRPIGLAEPALVAILPNIVVAEIEVRIVVHEDLRNLPKVRATFDHLVEEFTRFIHGN